MYTTELEHAIGYSCTEKQSLHVHPVTGELIYLTGSSIVSRSFEDAHSQTFLKGHSDSISCLDLSSARGTFLASGDCGIESDVVVWDYQEKRELWRFGEHDGGVRLVKFSHDERLLISIGQKDNRLTIWDLKTGMIVASVDIPKGVGSISDVIWGGFVKNIKRRNTDSYKFATVGEIVCLWSLNPYTGELAYQPAAAGRNIRKFTCATFIKLPDSCGRDNYEDEWLVAGTTSGDFSSFIIKADQQGNVPNANFVSSTSVCSSGVVSITSDPTNGSVVAVGGGDGTMSVFSYRISDGKWIDEEGISLPGSVYGLTMSVTGNEIVAGCTGGLLVRCFRGQVNKDRMIIISENHTTPITALSFAPGSSDTFATSSLDGSIRVWSIDDYSVRMQTTKSGTTSRTKAEGNDYATCLYFTIDAILSGWTDGCIRSHHAVTGELLWVITNAHTGGVTALQLSHNMRFILSGGEKGEVRVWELRQRQLVSHLQEHSRAVTQLVLFDDDMHAISCSKDKSFLCWDLKHDKRISANLQRTGGINDIALNHDETLVISVGQERSISFWDLREPYPVMQIDTPALGMHYGEATCIAVSHQGNLFATGGSDYVVKLWEIMDGKPHLLQNNQGHTGTITSLKFTEDDMQLVSVGTDGAIFVWNIFADEPNTKK